jgi:OPA family sugar phosphate sensor protein UhpC-like MFS transporter
LQDIASGWLIESNKVIVGADVQYNFMPAATFWIAASTISFVLALFVWKPKHTIH